MVGIYFEHFRSDKENRNLEVAFCFNYVFKIRRSIDYLRLFTPNFDYFQFIIEKRDLEIGLCRSIN